MRVLAFDCAGAQCAAAILDGERIVAKEAVQSERGHAQLLMPLLIGLTKRAGLSFADVDRFAVTTGPGSFTGIRVALATAHGLALGTGRPVVGVDVFDVYTAAIRDVVAAERLLIAVESRRAECFVRLFDRNGAPQGTPAMLPPDEIAAWAGPGMLAVAGDAAERVIPFLPGSLATGDRGNRLDAAVLAQIAAQRTPGGPPVPFYLRAPDAIPGKARRLRG